MQLKFLALAGGVLLSLAAVALVLDAKFSTTPEKLAEKSAKKQAEDARNLAALDQNRSPTSNQSPAEGTAGQAGLADASAGAIYALTKTDQAGRAQSFAQWSGKLLVINFWATWCAPCLEEMPMFAQMQQKHVLNGLQIVGIAADNAANVRTFASKLEIDYPLFPDEVGAIGVSKRLGNRLGLLPHTVAIAPNGQIVFNKMGKVREDELVALVRSFGPKPPIKTK